ncbi:MAG TPA: DUF6498-containing protein [bacterium]|nr:DUF6498-containing protein [bacterium]
MVQLCLNIALPLIGILFFGWSIADIYFLFFMEVLFLGAFTGLKILVSINNGSLLERFGQILFFSFLYVFIFLLLFGLIGYFFDYSKPQAQLTLQSGAVYALLGSYGVDFAYSFLWKGEYKRRDIGSQLEDEAAYRMLGLLFAMLVILVPLGTLMRSGNSNIALGIAIVLAKNLVDYYMVQNSHRHPVLQKAYDRRKKRRL